MSLIITGTQRSGTSLIAKMFIEEGYMEESFWDEEAKGGYENVEIAGFYRNYLGDVTFPFDDFPDILRPAGDQLERFEGEVAKFSYLLMNPAFVYIWHKFRPANDKFLILMRAPEAVVSSKLALPNRFDHDSLLLKQTRNQLQCNLTQSRRVLENLGYLSTALYFDDLFEPWGYKALARALAVLTDSFFISRPVFDKVIKPEWRHF